MKELGVSFIRLVFENVETLDIGIEDVVMLEIGGIDKIIEGWGREVKQLSTAGDISIVINERANYSGKDFTFNRLVTKNRRLDDEGKVDKSELLNQLSKRRGIASIELHSEDSKIDDYLVSWSNNHNTINSDIRYDFNSKGDLLITINKDSQLNKEIAKLFYDGMYLDLLKRRSE